MQKRSHTLLHASLMMGFPPKPTASIRSNADPPPGTCTRRCKRALEAFWGSTVPRNLEMSSLPRLSQVAEMQGTLLPKQKQRPAVAPQLQSPKSTSLQRAHCLSSLSGHQSDL